MPFEPFDIILVVLMLVSGILAMIRGFSREILSISSWIIAGITAFMFYGLLAPTVAGYTISFTSNELVPNIIAGAIVFLIVLIIVSLITLKIADFIVDSRVGALDRTLGFVFGALRGALLVTVMLMFFVNFFPESQPGWVANAKSKPLLESVGQSIIQLIPDDPAKFVMEKLGIGEDPVPEGQES